VRLLPWFFLASLAASCALGCDSPPDPPAPEAVAAHPDDGLEPVQIADDIPRGSRRIVCLAPNLTEIVFALGAGDRIIGVSDYATYPAEVADLPRVGGLLNPNLEKILKLAPDVIFLHASNRELADRLGRLGLRTVSFSADSIEDVYKIILRMGQELGVEADAGGIVTGMKRELRHLAVPDSAPKVKTLVVIGRTDGSLAGLRTAGEGSYVNELVVLVGGENIAASTGKPWPELSKEFIVAAAPSVIVELSPGATSDEAEDLAPWAALPGIPAVRDRRVHRLTEDHLLIPGPRLVSTARALRDALDAARSETKR
jgi:iron complex transport system substrate-binding protein